MQKIILLSVLVCWTSASWAQDSAKKYWVYLNESAVDFSQPMLGPDALVRRSAQGIALRTSDFALQQSAVTAVNRVADVVGRSRWLRAVVVKANDTQIAVLKSLPEVASLQPVGIMKRSLTELEVPLSPASTGDSKDSEPHAASPEPSSEEEGIQAYQYGASLAQVTQIQLDVMHDDGFDGAGVKIALMDGGYAGAESYSAFLGAWQQGRVLGTWDYVDGDSNVFHLGSHGMSVWSTICSDLDGTFVGTAPKASFYLFKTENQATETIAEEYHWVMAAERSDSLGVDVINTSLGYTTFDNGIDDHSYADMDGRSIPISIAAVAAARTGMILCISAGNEGSSSWKYISAPSDADSILAVGAVDEFGIRAGFSGQGPSFDGRIKPDVSARGVGAAVMNSNGQVATSSGTSLSSPIMAGAMASLVQAAKMLPNGYSAQNLIQRVRLSASQAFAPDSFLGYGIPNFATVYNGLGLNSAPVIHPWFLNQSNDGAWILRRMDLRSSDRLEYFAADGRLIQSFEVAQGQAEVRIEPQSFWGFVRSKTQVLPVAPR
jgi:serine protease AprX